MLAPSRGWCADDQNPFSRKELAMLGEQLGTSSGKITGTRILSTDGPNTRVEVSFQGSGTLLGASITDMGTYEQIVRPDGVLYGEGKVIMLTASGDMLPWSGFGVGLPTGPAPAASFGVCGAFNATTERFPQLTRVTTAIEYEVTADGSYEWTAWEWTGSKPG
jgi:hypothetical protein